MSDTSTQSAEPAVIDIAPQHRPGSNRALGFVRRAARWLNLAFAAAIVSASSCRST
jgi:hypothetical protein